MSDTDVSHGLTDVQVLASRAKHGANAIVNGSDRLFIHVLKEVVLEPMFILLLAACLLYFIAGEAREGFIMVISVLIVSGISFFQEYRSRNAVMALKKLSDSRAKLIRNGTLLQVPTEEVVVGDVLLIEEGEVPAADGLIRQANDLSLNESVLTGEAFPVFKFSDTHDSVYKGTLVTSGSAVIEVKAVGKDTMLGRIGQSLENITVLKTPLQLQVRSFVKNMVRAGFVAFVLVVGYNYYQTTDMMQALMQGLTLAMSLLPEEIPVAFSTFQALGAFRLLRSNVIVKQPQYVETLGSATVICADKTGTLTQNRMQLDLLFDAATGKSVPASAVGNMPHELLEYAMWSSETNPFDPMEKAIHGLYGKTASIDKRLQYTQVHEYPVSGRPPMMTHIFSNSDSGFVIAAKGAPEAILAQSDLPEEKRREYENQSIAYARNGYRVLGVGKGIWNEKKWPASQESFTFRFLGLIAFLDPPKDNMAQTISKFYDAGIEVKVITGDYAETTMAIAAQAGIRNNKKCLLGKEVLQMELEQLQLEVKEVNIFARMFPEAKMKVIEALKANAEVVAMTGDGVNDGPALKASHIGIAMGKRGSDVAKSAASLILADDDLSHMVDAVALGRKIYDNLKKAIQYIVSIHIPIILIVTLPLLLMWDFTDIFSPVHVIFLELIMGPTCSIIYENEPMEPGTMNRPPRKMSNTFLTFNQLLLSIVQGLVITAGCLGTGYYYLQQQADETQVRTVIFITLLLSNIFLTLVNRSFRLSIFSTMKYRNNLVPIIIIITLIFLLAFLYIPYMQQLFRLRSLPVPVYATCAIIAFAATMWMEIWKKVRFGMH